ncbi:hypothetical protein [Luteipulveratus halotolerans]|uniref:Uncharacterized protein n=1 Tax=Luteipulveratus halotolerans TaxID=1631356 RepID=A0A0L6CIU5_9MICO|nr:hypothetical protein [Luteipulveratus halotolerans]KNX37722.1 hypothetical protein VV01_12125 [Luteipulveratus halotolerans]
MEHSDDLDLVTLVRDTPAPPMTIDPDRVRSRGRRRARRRRAVQIGVTAAVAGVLVGLALQGPPISADRGTFPAASSSTVVDDRPYSFFGSMPAGLPRDQVEFGSNEPQDVDSTNPTERLSAQRYQVRESSTGALTVVRAGSGRALKEVARLKGGVVQLTDGERTIVVAPVPSATTGFDPVSTSEADFTSATTVGAVLPSGRRVAVSDSPLLVGRLTAVRWFTSTGEVRSSTGERAGVARVPGGFVYAFASDPTRFGTFMASGVGMQEAPVDAFASEQTSGGSPDGTAAPVTTYALALPRGATDLTVISDGTPLPVRPRVQPLAGTPLDAVTFEMTEQGGEVAAPPTRSITWKDAAGRPQTRPLQSG